MIATVDSVQVQQPAQPQSERIQILQKTVSASRLNCFLSCRLRFAFRYLYEISKPPTASLHVGSVAHLVLKFWSMARWKRQEFQVERFRQLFDKHWAEQPGTIDWKDEESTQKSGAWALLETYFKETPIQSTEMPEAVEVPIEADLSKHGLPTLIGVLDLIRAGGRIVDFKTSSKTPNPEDAIHQNQIQLDCYSVLYRESTGKMEGGRELHFLIKLKQPKIVITGLEPMKERDQVRLFRLFDSYQEGLAREDFVPSRGLQCLGCEYFNECRQF
jgi:hypothetical protein